MCVWCLRYLKPYMFCVFQRYEISGEICVVWDEWCEMSGLRWVVRDDEWCGMSVMRCVAREWCEMRSVRSDSTNQTQPRTPGRHQHSRFFASLHGTATLNTIYTQPGAKPAHNLHTARRLTRMPGRHQHTMFASPHGTPTLTQFTHSNAPKLCFQIIL